MAFDINTATPVKKTGFDMSTAKPAEAQAPQFRSVEGDFIPTGENLALSARPQQPDRTIGETLVGAGETALSALTGATGGAAGFLSAVPGAVAGELSGRLKQGEGFEEAAKRASDFTFAPRTEAGQEFSGDLSEVLGVLPPVIGSSPLASSRLPKAPIAAPKATRATRKSFDRKQIESQFTQSTFKKVNEARRQGFDEGMTTAIADAAPTDRLRMQKMVDIVEKGKGNELFKAENRPADVVGDSVLRKVEFLDSNKKQAGKQLGRVAERLEGKPIDITEHTNGFLRDLEDVGVKFDDNGKPDFDLADFGGVTGSENLVSKILLRLKRNPPTDALSAHKLKKFIDENVTHGKSQEGLSGITDRLTKKLRAGINNEMSAEFKPYKEANARFSDSITALDELQSAVGKVNFKAPSANKALGTSMRRLLSNAQSRAPMIDAINSVERTAKKYGGDFDDDIMTQMLFADELDAVFGGGGRTSLKGEVKKANVDAAIDLSQMSIPGAVAVGAKAGAKRLRGINEKNQLKSIKDLLKNKN